MVEVTFTTATELAQIDKAQEARERTDKTHLIKMKQIKVLVETPKGVKTLVTPYYTGNGFRGKLRRKCFELILQKVAERNLKITPEAFHLMNAGGGSTYSQQSFEVEKQVRELNPLVSVFGASLAISGKLKTSNLMPYRNINEDSGEYYYAFDEKEEKIFSTITQKNMLVKIDDLLDRRGTAKYVSDEVIQEWQETSLDNIKNVSATRDSDKKIKKETIRSNFNHEFVIRGVDFYGSIGEIDALSDIEKGMIYKALESLVLENLGAYKSKNFGLCNYTLKYEDGSILKTKVNEYLKPQIIQKDYKEETQGCIESFEKWLEELTEESILIEKILIKNKD